jgi:hypothetical protein
MGRRRSDIPPDPAPEYTEWIQHQYDPGYWLGGRVPPYLRREQTKNSRGNRYGWLLLLGVVMTVIEIPAVLRDNASGMRFLHGMLIAATALISVVAGVRLLSGPKAKGDRRAARRRNRS